MNNFNNMYFRGGNILINIVILAIIVVAALWVLGMFAGYLPALLVLLFHVLIVLYGVFGLISILTNPQNRV
jgi:hypothetical protein